MSAIPEGSVPKTDAALMGLGKFWSGGGIMHKSLIYRREHKYLLIEKFLERNFKILVFCSDSEKDARYSDLM